MLGKQLIDGPDGCSNRFETTSRWEWRRERTRVYCLNVRVLNLTKFNPHTYVTSKTERGPYVLGAGKFLPVNTCGMIVYEKCVQLKLHTPVYIKTEWNGVEEKEKKKRRTNPAGIF